MTFKIRHLVPWKETDLIIDDLHFSADFRTEEADALLCDFRPQPELLEFPRRKALYRTEGWTSDEFKTPEMQHYRAQLQSAEFLWHGHPDPAFRVPHVTHVDRPGELCVNRNPDRIARACAIVSNVARPPSRRTPAEASRLRYILDPGVDLFGRLAAWQSFLNEQGSVAGPPGNYRGEVAGQWNGRHRVELLSRYKACVCLENTIEPHYFTEKFVGAVQAGCIPIYHAEATTIRRGILDGARWVDPADFDFDVAATLRHALDQDAAAYWQANGEWLQGDFLRTTSTTAVYRRIGRILQGRS